jgi:uncharacterized repeat protein (TIGR02543 family)
LLIFLSLASCAPPVQDGGGNVRIVLGGTGARYAVSEAERDNFTYTLDFSGPGGEQRHVETLPGATNVTLTLTPGKWTVHADAWHNDTLFGSGDADFTAYGGRGNTVTITMEPSPGNSFLSGLTYTITFETHGGTNVAAITQDEGINVSQPADPAKDGFTFNGWFSEETGGTLYTWPHTLSADVTMHAQWQDDSLPPPSQYTITFETYGGTNVAAITEDEGTSVSKPADPAKSGFNFTGWFSAASGGTIYTWPHTLSADVTMHAQWAAVPTYTITFETYGGTNVAAITEDGGTSVSKPADPAKSGFNFTGWFSAANGGTIYSWPHTLSADITMHAQWAAVPTYTVTFHPNGGNPAPVQQTVTEGGKATAPGITRAAEGLYAGTVATVDTLNVTLQGWYTNPAYTTAWNFDSGTVTEDLDLYAKWSAPVVDLDSQSGDNTLAKALAYIAEQTLSVITNYTIVLEGGCSMGGVTSSAEANISTENAVITLVGKGSPKIIYLSTTGSLFYISAGKLILGNNITLTGHASNDASLVYVDGSSAFLSMETGATITGNTTIDSGGGVYVGSGGSFTMEGGVISGNSADSAGGGVVVSGGGSFIMEGGVISGNSAFVGGGVYVFGSSFTMEDGVISGNSAYGGGGVGIGNGGSFSKTGGTIYGDTDNIAGNGNATDNTATMGDTWGHAVIYVPDISTAYYRDTDLIAGDNISTSIPGSGWDQ